MPASADRSASAEAEPSSTVGRMLKTPPRRTLLRALLVLALGTALFAGIGFFVVPRVIKAKLEETLTAELHRKTTVEHVAFNPFTLTTTLQGIAIRNRDADSSFLTVDEVVANASGASLWHRAPVVDELKVRAPHIDLVRNANGSYNIQDLIDAYFASPPGPPPAFSLNNIEITDGAINFDDRTVKHVHKIEGLHIGIPFLSSLPYDTEIKVAPALAAKVNGARFDLTGETTPFAPAQQASLNIDLDSLSLPQILDYLPLPLKVRVASGELTTKLKLAFVGGNATTRTLVISGDASLAKLAVQRQDGAPLVAVAELKVALDKVDVFGRAVDVARVTITRPEFDVRRKSDGEFEWAALAGAAAMGAPAGPGTAAAPWQARIRELTVDGATARLEDQSTTPQFQATLGDMKVHAAGLANTPGAKAQVELSLTTNLGATITGDAMVTLVPVTAQGKLKTVGVNVNKLYPYYASAINLEVADGALDIATTFSIVTRDKRPPAISLSGGSAEVRNLRLLFPGERDPLWTVPTLTATGIAVDVDAHTITLDEALSRQAEARIRRERDGSFNFARIMRTTESTGRNAPPVPASAAAPPPATSVPAVATAPPADATWQLLLRKAALLRTTVDFQDRTPAKPVALRFTELDVQMENISNGRGKRGALDLRSKVGSNGRLAVKGPLGTNPVGGNLRIDAQGIALAPLQPYLDGIANLTVTSGNVNVKGNVALDPAAADRVRVAFAGDVAIADFASLDKPSASDLVKWKTLALTGIEATSSPVKLGIGSIALDDFYARMIVYPEGTFNLTQLLASSGDTPAADATPPSAATTPPSPSGAQAPAGAASGGLPITIGQVTLAKGEVQFSDFFVKPNYSAHLTDVNGKISAMSKTVAGEVEIDAAVERTAPVDIRGRINPFASDLDLDITAKAHEIELPPLSPYAGKYAGYAIEKGKLSFDVQYKIENRKLSAQNKLVLDQLTFGERIESPSATKLPVLLAVALLKDRNGVIDINLPISGSLDDPEFSVGGLIIQVIVNLLTKAVTAPFALLGAVFGGGEQLAYVEFAPGHAAITPPAEAKLKTLAKALADRPALKLDIAGRAEAATDSEGLRHAELERAVKAQKRKVLAAERGSPPPLDAIVVETAEYPRYLEAAYADATFTKPRNAIGLAKTLPPPEMEALILQNAKADDEALRALAYERAEAVKDWLTGAGGVPADRVFLLAPKSETAAPKDGGKPNRVDFALR